MAILWSKKQGDDLYEVRNAGATLRLYSNGVLHTEFNPSRLITGSVWDLLFIPSAFLCTIDSPRILLLGLGGGAVIELYRRAWPQATIDAVELNAVHLQVYRRFFSRPGSSVNLYHADAVAWLKQHRKRYDIIIDDLFGHEEGVPLRAIEFNPQWLALLRSHLRAGGLYIGNFADSQDVRATTIRMQGRGFGFNSAVRFYASNCENIVVCGSDRVLDSAVFRRNKKRMLAEQASFRKLNYRYRRV